MEAGGGETEADECLHADVDEGEYVERGEKRREVGEEWMRVECAEVEVEAGGRKVRRGVVELITT